jgi:hypothetical protein
MATSITIEHAIHAALRQERDEIVGALEAHMRELRESPHEAGGVVSGAITAFSQAIRVVQERQNTYPKCQHIWQRGAPEDPLFSTTYTCDLCGTHITETEMRLLHGDR